MSYELPDWKGRHRAYLTEPEVKEIVEAWRSGRLVDREAINPLKKMVDEQVLDDGLWFTAASAPEAYLQQELRQLHTLIETSWLGIGDTDE